MVTPATTRVTMAGGMDTEDTEVTEDTVRDGDEVILTHEVTGRNLHSHDVPALGDKRLRQVTGHNKTKTRANLNPVLRSGDWLRGGGAGRQ